MTKALSLESETAYATDVDGSSTSAVSQLSAWISSKATPGVPFLVGVTGSVASGKTTLTHALALNLGQTHTVAIASTDGLLFSNAELEARGLLLRKGFPETYNTGHLIGLLQRAKLGPIAVPGYSHTLYDIDPTLARTVDRPDVLFVEGLGLSPQNGRAGATAHLDALIYIDADETHLESWFVARFLKLWAAAESDPTSFYARFRSLDRAGAEAFARRVWRDINLPNLREHIVAARTVADIVIEKAASHALRIRRLPDAAALAGGALTVH